MPRIAIILTLVLSVLLGGCELVADFDRDKIPSERPDAGPDAGTVPDEPTDPPDAAMPGGPVDASTDEPDPDDVDAGDDDAGDDDGGA